MSAFILRLIACMAMLLDHLGYYSNNMTLRAIGRIAFPIFVYLVVNGYGHTSCKWRYALRLTLFAVLSQIPFGLFCANSLFYGTGNVFVTLLMALLSVWGTDVLWKRRALRWLCWLPAAGICLLYLFHVLESDYGIRGIVMAMTFYLFDGKKLWQRLLTVAGCLLSVFSMQLISVAYHLLQGQLMLPAMSRWDWWQLFSLLALPLIFLYNGRKGPAPRRRFPAKLVQLSFYLFYPLHMLILWLVHILLM